MKKSYGWLTFAITIKSIWCLCLLLICIFISWTALVKVNFNYDFWYEQLSIKSTIDFYAPKNPQHKGFIYTDKKQHSRLFSEIVAATTNKPENLRQIRYKVTGSSAQMLTPDEITHLNDVHSLIKIFNFSSYIAIATLIPISILMLFLYIAPPKILVTCSIATCTIATAGLIIFLYGPVEIFYTLHIIIFPAGHKWFFYYDESLMSMIMQAPNIFGYIAATLILMASAIFIALLFVARKLYFRIENSLSIQVIEENFREKEVPRPN